MPLSPANSSVKVILGWLLVFAIRLVPFRPPNFEPMMAALMPFSKGHGPIVAFLFGALGIALYDLAWGLVGSWTIVTALTYGALGILSWLYFRKRETSVRNFLIAGIAGTLLYDAVTGVAMGPLLYGQPFMEALLGQIPFTLMHLLGTVTFSIVLSPLLYRWIVANQALSVAELRARFGF